MAYVLDNDGYETVLYWSIAILLLILTKGRLGYKKEKTDL